MSSPFKFLGWDPLLGGQESLRCLESWLETPSPSCIVSRALLRRERGEIRPSWGLWGRFGEVERAGVCAEVRRL